MYFAVLHELGHALGLPHASDPAAIMSVDGGNRLYFVQHGTRAVLTSTDVSGCQIMMSAAR